MRRGWRWWWGLGVVLGLLARPAQAGPGVPYGWDTFQFGWSAAQGGTGANAVGNSGGQVDTVCLTANTPCLSNTVTGLGTAHKYTCLLTVSAATGTPTSLNVFLQQAVDGPAGGGTTWNDVGHFTQVGNATGSWFLHFSDTDVNTSAGVVTAGGAVADGSLAAATTLGGYIGDRLRAKAVLVGGTSYKFRVTCQASGE